MVRSGASVTLLASSWAYVYAAMSAALGYLRCLDAASMAKSTGRRGCGML